MFQEPREEERAWTQMVMSTTLEGLRHGRSRLGDKIIDQWMLRQVLNYDHNYYPGYDRVDSGTEIGPKCVNARKEALD